MPLTLAQRIDRLQVRTAEIAHWRERESIPIADWTFNGMPHRAGDPWPEIDGLHRLEADAIVPDHWPVPESWLDLDLGGESLLTFRSGNGHATYGHDPMHQAFPAPARSFTIEAESTARLPFGEPVRDPKIKAARLYWRDDAVHKLHVLLTLIGETARQIADDEAAVHLVAAAEKAVITLDWPSASADYVARIAASPQQQAIWGLPDHVSAPRALDESQRGSVQAAYNRLGGLLRALKSRFPQKGVLAVCGHAHIDLAWLWPYDETRRKLRRSFHTVVNLLDEFPDFKFTQSTAAYYAQLEEDDPALLEKIGKAVARGQWEPQGGMWVEPDTNMPSGEGLVRQILYGQRYFEKRFGARHRVCWLPDCFGFTPALPQLLKQGGMDYFFTTKMNWSETNQFPYDIFQWEGLDGTRILSHSFNNPQMSYNGTVEPEVLTTVWDNFRGKDIHDESLITIGYGDGGGGPNRQMLERKAYLADFPALPAMHATGIEEFFERMRDETAARDLPVWYGEMYLELHRATLTTQARTKFLYRRAEHALIAAETVASLAHMCGASPAASLEPLWRVVMKNAFHDILPGSSIGEVHAQAEAELADVLARTKQAEDDALDVLTARLPKGDIEDALVVVNPTLHERPLQIETDDQALAGDASLPPLSITVLDRATISAPGGLSVGERTMENAFVRIELGEDGTIVSLFDKRADRESLADRGNQLWAYPMDKPRRWDAWDIDGDYTEKGEEIAAVEAMETVERSDARVAIRIARRYRDSRITQTLRLWANAPRLELVTELDWHDRRVLLRALTPVAVRSDHASYECAFGLIRRPTHRNTSWDAARFEVPAHRFADLSEPGFGVSLLNDGRYGHSVGGNVLGLSLLRSPVFPDPLADEGHHRFIYALQPHGGDLRSSGVRQAALDLNQPLAVRPASGLQAGTTTPLTISGIAAGLAALKPAEDGDDVILRVYEPYGGRGAMAVDLRDGWRVRGAVSLLEDDLAAPTDRLGPFQVRSLRLSRADETGQNPPPAPNLN